MVKHLTAHVKKRASFSLSLSPLQGLDNASENYLVDFSQSDSLQKELTFRRMF